MTDPIPDSAVEAAARAFDAAEYDDPDSVTEAEWAVVSGAEREFYLSAARRALTAAAPYIAADLRASRDGWASRMMEFAAAQRELADLRAGIEALRDEWAERTVAIIPSSVAPASIERLTWGAAANALDALLRGAK